MLALLCRLAGSTTHAIANIAFFSLQRHLQDHLCHPPPPGGSLPRAWMWRRPAHQYPANHPGLHSRNHPRPVCLGRPSFSVPPPPWQSNKQVMTRSANHIRDTATSFLNFKEPRGVLHQPPRSVVLSLRHVQIFFAPRPTPPWPCPPTKTSCRFSTPRHLRHCIEWGPATHHAY